MHDIGSEEDDNDSSCSGSGVADYSCAPPHYALHQTPLLQFTLKQSRVAVFSCGSVSQETEITLT